LWALVQGYLDRQEWPVSERRLAERLGYASSSTFDNWRHPRQLPSSQALARFAALSGTPYQRVLDAALTDAGYLPEPALTRGDLVFREDPKGRRSRGQRTRSSLDGTGEESQG
jgi:hypothetical protein